MSKIIDGLNDAVAYAEGDKTRGKLVKAPKLSQEMQDCLNWLKLNPGWHSSYGSPWSRKTLDTLHKRGLVRRKSGLGSIFSPIFLPFFSQHFHPIQVSSAIRTNPWKSTGKQP